MRKLILTRGHPGSGKTHALREIGMEDWTLSADTLRSVIAAPFLTQHGQTILNQDVNDRVFPMMNRLADERMRRGETLAIDTTLIERSDIEKWAELARQHRYKVAVLDMAGTSLDAAIARNALRSETRQVPSYRIMEMHALLHESGLREVKGVHVIHGKDDGSHISELDDWVREPVADLSGYRRIVHVGDLQGCFTVLAGEGGPLADGFRDDTFYIFVGDLLDRGIENGKVMRWFVDHALHRRNVALLWGNHEDHLHRWAKGLDAVSNEFGRRTLPQLLAAGVTPEDADAVCDKALDFLHYRYADKEVLVTHAGLSTFPEKPHLVSLEQFSRGTGYWSDPVDEQFERNSSRGYQVHGHRNNGHVAVQATPRSFNLEDSVEFGGHLRTCTLDRDGWSTAEYRNHVFMALRERIGHETIVSPARRQERKLLPHWIVQGGKISTEMDRETLALMRSHPGVREKSSERYPHVSSLNFTKRVFYDRSWDDIVVKARGLFINRDSGKIVSRGYDKFFNVEERPETTLEFLLQNLVFPLRGYIKENGFLGNTGYDEQTDTVFRASKSTPDGDFADMFRTILNNTLNESQEERLRRYLRDTESSMTFEVIDPVNDPHMIEYDRPKVVLLDIIRRSTDFEKAEFEVVEAVGQKIGFETKKLGMTFKNATSFAGWYKRATRDINYRIGGKHVEGIVIEDARGFMTKVKLPYYAHWKQMRSMKDRIVAARVKGMDFSYDHVRRPDGTAPSPEEVEMAESFRDWCEEQDNETLSLDIISLRKAFGRDFGMEAKPRAFAP